MNFHVHIMSDNISPTNKNRVQKIVENHGQSAEFIDAKSIRIRS